jgi:hypothetical protein
MSDELDAAAGAGDGDAMAALAARLQARAHALDLEARDWIRRAALAGSLKGWHAWVRVTVADGDFDPATGLLLQIEQRFPDVPSSQWVDVAPDVLGRDLALDSDSASDLPGAGVFTVITPYGDRALEALRETAEQLLAVDERGGLEEELPPDGTEPLFTPSYVELRWNHLAVQVILDTSGEMTGPMGRTMVAMLVDALAAARIPAHIAGDRPELRPEPVRGRSRLKFPPLDRTEVHFAWFPCSTNRSLTASSSKA